MAQELHEPEVAALALAPGHLGVNESTEYMGRAIAALARDPDVMAKSGRTLTVGDLAREYGFTDTDGSQPEPFRLKGSVAPSVRTRERARRTVRCGRVGAVELDRMRWPDVKAEIEAGRDTVVVAFGATEQHGPHLPLATDALIGDHLARLVADRLDAFVAPTVRIGCSEHHLEFPGTISISEQTFHALVADVVRSLARGGFRRIVLIPTHGGNFGPLAAALEKIGTVDGVQIRALTDLGALFAIARVGVAEHNVPMGEGGLHAGEWETSMLLAIHPDLVDLGRGQAGYTGDMEAAVAGIFAGGVHSVSENGVLGDPTQASAEHGERYWSEALALALAAVAPESVR